MSTINTQQRLTELYEQYSDHVYRFIYFMIQHEDKAEDLTQETFIRAYKGLSQFKGDAQEKTWLFSIARHVTIDHIRKEKRFTWFTKSLEDNDALGDNAPEQVLMLKEDEKRLYEALAHLKESYRMVIYLRKIKQISIEETARILGISEGKVKTDLRRGLVKLKEQMIKEGYYAAEA